MIAYSLRTLLFAFLILAFPAFVMNAAAQMPIPGVGGSATAPPQVEIDSLTQAEARDLMSRISDDEVRALLLQQLDKVAVEDAAAADGSLIVEWEDKAERINAGLQDMLGAAPEVPSTLALLPERLREAGGVGNALMALAILLVGGFAAATLWRLRMRNRKGPIVFRNAEGTRMESLAIIGNALIGLVVSLSSVLIFYIAAIILMFAFWGDNDIVRQFLGAYVTATALTLAIVAIVEIGFPGDHPDRRILALSDPATRRFKIFMGVLAIVYTFGFLTCALLDRYGAPVQAHLLMLEAVGALFVTVMIAMFFSMRTEVGTMIRGTPGRPGFAAWLRNLFAVSWHLLASAYLLLLWFLSIGRLLLSDEPVGGGVGPGLIALLLMFAVPVADVLIGRFLVNQCGTNSALAGALRRTARVILIVGAAALFLSLWGADLDRVGAAGITGWIIGAVIDVGVVLLIGYAAWQLVRAYFDNLLAQEDDGIEIDPDAPPKVDGEGGGGGATRSATLLPLLRSVALATIGLMAGLTALSGLGVDIGPLLAGAGVIGIAIGFGAQTLVRDIVSGIFFLVDDAFRMGEYIVIENTRGAVEKISIRSLRLRHHRGPLHTVPFGEIKTLTNYSRDWVIMKLPLRLTYDTDPQKVKKIIKVIGAEMMADELLSPGLIEPPKSQGVLQMEDSAMILRVKFMAKPGEQFVLRRELLHRIRSAFNEQGIQFANREVTVHVASSDLNTEDTEAAAAAAARTILDQEAEALQGPAKPGDDR